MKNQRSGFTLVELMIVVAIIGILAAIAVPNYQKYQAKARQAEIKLNLAAAHTALTAFQTENSSYTACLASIGVGTGQGRQYYAFGFNNAASGVASCGPAGGTSCMAYAWNTAGTAATCNPADINFAASAAVATAGAAATPLAVTAIPATANVITSSTFTIGGAGQISANGQDHWTIDQAKTLVNVQSGL